MKNSTRFSLFALCFGSLLSFLNVTGARAQGYLTVSDGHVEADVNRSDGWGLLDLYYFDMTGTRQRLTFSNFSYLTVEVNGDFFTNDSYLTSGMDWETGENVDVQYLNNATNVKINDTIESTWLIGTNGFAIIQEVYPVHFSNSGQIVYRWFIRNDSNRALSAQGQFLLDLETSDNSGANDNPKITTREGYNESNGQDFWHNFQRLPPYFLTSEYDICTKSFPGMIAAGYTVDDFAPVAMGLIKPSLMANVDFKEYSALGNPPTVWGFPQSFEGTPMSNDNALVFQWPATSVAPNATVEIGCGSYGTAPCDVCFGNLDATLLHPDHIVWNGTSYVPNHFPVEEIIWNSNSLATATRAVATQTISNAASGLGGPVRIVSQPSLGVISGGSASADSTIQECGVSHVTWEDTVLQNVLLDCNTDSLYNISLSLNASGVGMPIFPGGACLCPILVDCQTTPDTTPGIPNITVLNRSGSFDGSICNARVIDAQATDPRMCAPCFVKSVSAIQLQNMKFSVIDSSSWKFRLSVIDSMQNGSATVVAVDNEVGVSDTATFTYCTIPDTHAPKLVVSSDDSCSCERISISDNQAWDRGLDTVIIDRIVQRRIDTTIPAENPNFVVHGLRQAMISTVPTSNSNFSEICITAIDLAGNRIDSCFDFGSQDVRQPKSVPFFLNVAPNPTSSVATISLTGAPSANVEVFDVLGREVVNFRMLGSYEWNMASLPEGAYIVRAEASGGVVSRQVMKQ